ncbi:MAG: acyltransferase family protein [Clostridium sp.]|nr:acyltransferase family protein [Clostridium sp.]
MMRNNGLDLLRIISTVAVIFIHVNAYYFLNGTSQDSTEYVIQELINLITRFCVPCFVMISGAFNISEKNINIHKFYMKVLKKIFLPFLVIVCFFILLMEISAWFREGKIYFYQTPFVNFIKGTILNYWFMYMLFGLYMCTPFIVRMKKSISVKTAKVTVLVWMVVACISQLTTEYRLPYTFGVIASYLGYYMLGDLLYENMKKIKKRIFLLVPIILLYMLTLIPGLGWKNYMLNPYASFFFPTIIVISLLIFLLFLNIEININLSKLAGYMYYIYLFHTVIYQICFNFLDDKIFINKIFTICMIGIVTFLISLMAAIIFEKIWNAILYWVRRITGQYK